MRSAIAILTLWSISVSAVSDSVSESFDESFEYTGTNDTCPYYQYGLTCPDPLPGPVNGLLFKNLNAVNVILRHGIGQGSAEGGWYAAYNDSSKPAVLSPFYKNSCVKHWSLSSLAVACGATQNFTDPNTNNTYTFAYGYNCTMDVVGKNNLGFIVGREKFFYNPGPLRFDFRGLPYYQMAGFSTTKGGLKNKEIWSLEVYAKPVKGKDPSDQYVGDFSASLDAIQYTVTNSTRCAKKYGYG